MSKKRNKYQYNQGVSVFGLPLSFPLVLEVTKNNDKKKSKEYIANDSVNLYFSGTIVIMLQETLPDDMALC